MFKLFGARLTSTDKKDIDGESLPITIDDADFLCRRFVKRSGIVFAPLSYESLTAQLYYVRIPTFDATPAGLLFQLQTNLDNVLRELREYDVDEAFAIATKIKNFITLHRIPVRFDVPIFTPLAKLEYYA